MRFSALGIGNRFLVPFVQVSARLCRPARGICPVILGAYNTCARELQCGGALTMAPPHCTYFRRLIACDDGYLTDIYENDDGLGENQPSA